MTDGTEKPPNVSTRLVDRQRAQNELAYSMMLSTMWEGMAERHNEYQAAEALRFKPFLQQLDARLRGYEGNHLYEEETVTKDVMEVLSYATRCKSMFAKHGMDSTEGSAKRRELYLALQALQIRAVSVLAQYTFAAQSYSQKKVERIVHSEPVRSVLSVEERNDVVLALFPPVSNIVALKKI